MAAGCFNGWKEELPLRRSSETGDFVRSMPIDPGTITVHPQLTESPTALELENSGRPWGVACTRTAESKTPRPAFGLSCGSGLNVLLGQQIVGACMRIHNITVLRVPAVQVHRGWAMDHIPVRGSDG